MAIRLASSDIRIKPVAPDPLVLDLLQVADKKIQALTQDLEASKAQKHAADEKIKELHSMVSTREVCNMCIVVMYAAGGW